MEVAVLPVPEGTPGADEAPGMNVGVVLPLPAETMPVTNVLLLLLPGGMEVAVLPAPEGTPGADEAPGMNVGVVLPLPPAEGVLETVL